MCVGFVCISRRVTTKDVSKSTAWMRGRLLSILTTIATEDGFRSSYGLLLLLLASIALPVPWTMVGIAVGVDVVVAADVVVLVAPISATLGLVPVVVVVAPLVAVAWSVVLV